jgi:hypothetical protein
MAYAAAALAFVQGLTLIHFSAQPELFVTELFLTENTR